MTDITIFTDGSSRGNPGPGGWGSIVVIYNDQNKELGIKNGEVVELGGGEKHTTNNRMELTAVIRSLQFVLLKTHNLKLTTTVCTDSNYVLKGATQWLPLWQNNNWKTKAKDDVLNKDLWEELALVLETLPQISWKLIKGHSGVPANERCDEIATGFADGGNVPLYSGDVQEYTVDLTVQKKSSSSKSNNSKSKSRKGIPFSYISMVDGVVQTHASWLECEARVKGKSKALYKKAMSKEEEVSIISQWRQRSTS